MDTNFLMDLSRFRIELSEIHDLLLEPIELCVLSNSLAELNFLSKKAKHGRYAKLALLLIKNNHLKILDSPYDVDKAILASADKSTIVATNDMELRKQLRKNGIKTIYLRARKHLAID